MGILEGLSDTRVRFNPQDGVIFQPSDFQTESIGPQDGVTTTPHTQDGVTVTPSVPNANFAFYDAGLATYSSGRRFRDSAMSGVTFIDGTNPFAKVSTRIGAEDREAIQKIRPTIVRIAAKNKDGEKWYGSGAIVEPTDIIPGYIPENGEYFIITNHHVANEATRLVAEFAGGSEVRVELVTSPHGTPLMDAGMDIAILRIRVNATLATAKLGNPKELEAGQTIYTAGHPQALPNLVITKGIISQTAQETGQLSLDIQSDAPINPGNSGGPSFNQSGEIIGLNTYTFREGEDLTFTKSIDAQLSAIDTIWNTGSLVRGALPFTVAPLSLIDRDDMGLPAEIEGGAIVDSVEAGSSADAAGLKTGDIITWMEVRQNGAAIKTLPLNITDEYEAAGVIKRWAADLEPGTKVSLIVYRRDKKGYFLKEITVRTTQLL